jgi:hypothetical protein
MAQWQRHLRLQPEWSKAQEDEISVQELAGVIAERLLALQPFTGRDEWVESERIDLADEFAAISREASIDEEEFDGWMSQLYNWGDTALDSHWNGRKVCWIDTMSAPEPAA